MLKVVLSWWSIYAVTSGAHIISTFVRLIKPWIKYHLHKNYIKGNVCFAYKTVIFLCYHWLLLFYNHKHWNHTALSCGILLLSKQNQYQCIQQAYPWLYSIPKLYATLSTKWTSQNINTVFCRVQIAHVFLITHKQIDVFVREYTVAYIHLHFTRSAFFFLNECAFLAQVHWKIVIWVSTHMILRVQCPVV